MNAIRVGLVVPSSNTTMETEIPAMLHARESTLPERFSFHSSRMRMKHVTPEELKAMDDDSLRCAAELADARVKVLAYACLVAIMAQGNGYHCVSQERLSNTVAAEGGGDAPVVTSAGALVSALHHLGAKKIVLVAPYMRELTDTVISYIENEGIKVIDSVALEEPDNLKVGLLDPANLTGYVKNLNTAHADAIVLSACVQMPSLPALDEVQRQYDIPVLTAASATVWEILRNLGLDTVVPGAGKLLSGE